MNIVELINELEYMKDIAGEDAEVRFASQPGWPFEYSISNIIAMTNEMREENARAELQDEGLSEEEINKELEGAPELEGENVIYLAEGTQLGYLPGDVKNELGW
jgi:hypothetical protein